MAPRKPPNRIYRLAAVVAGVLAVAIPAVVLARDGSSESEAHPYPIPAGAKQLAAADFEGETLDPGWSVQAPPDRLVRQDGVVAQGSHAGYCERRDGDPLVANGNRAEIAAEPTLNSEHPELIYSGRFRVPGDTALPGDSWSIVYQWHGLEDSGSPPLALFVTGATGDPDFGLELGHGDGSRTDWATSGLAFDEWHAFTVRVRWSDSPSEGFLELWFDGKWQEIGPVGPNGVPRKTFATNTASDGVYLKSCIYRGSANTGTTRHYIDDIRIHEP